MATNRQARTEEVQLLVAKGAEQGYLTHSEINDLLPDDVVEPEQLEEVLGVLSSLNIQVLDAPPDADTLLLSDGATAT